MIISVKNPLLILIIAIPVGIALHGFWGPSMTALLNLAPIEKRGTVMGITSSMIALIEGTSPAIVGYLAEKTSLLFGMQVLIAIFFIAVVPLLLTKRLGERILVGP
jgi:MFS-type transporter involved in bile tolerance (Atg22 family)